MRFITAFRRGLSNTWEKGRMIRSAKQNPQAIQIFLDKKKNILFIPMLHTKPGFGKSISYYKTLEPPYTCADMGNI